MKTLEAVLILRELENRKDLLIEKIKAFHKEIFVSGNKISNPTDLVMEWAISNEKLSSLQTTIALFKSECETQGIFPNNSWR